MEQDEEDKTGHLEYLSEWIARIRPVTGPNWVFFTNRLRVASYNVLPLLLYARYRTKNIYNLIFESKAHTKERATADDQRLNREDT
jgi:hypothetical protein